MNNLPILGPWLRRFFTEHISTERNLALNTQKSYRDSFTLLLPYISKKARKPVDRLSIQDLTAKRVLDFLHYIETERGCSIQTRNQRLAAIRAFARYVSSREPACVEWAGGIRAITTKKAAPQPVSWVTKDEMEAMLKVPDVRKPRGRVEHALLLFVFNTGARVSETVAVQVKDLQINPYDGKDALVTLHGKGGKMRRCPLWPRTVNALTELIRDKHQNECVFISQQRKAYTRFGVYRLVERCAGAVPALSDRQITPHSVRHSCACFLLRSGVDLNTIRAWLGHVHLDTTNIYAEIDLQMKAEAMKLCDAAEPEPVRSWQNDTKLMDFLTSF